MRRANVCLSEETCDDKSQRLEVMRQQAAIRRSSESSEAREVHLLRLKTHYQSMYSSSNLPYRGGRYGYYVSMYPCIP